MHQVSGGAGAVERLTGDGETRPRYRPDVDGLRAIAIVSVVLFHAHVPMFGGGFVGVDIFFVISGFLIGGIVFRDVSRGRYSFTTFYARRAKRIVPALLGMSLVVSAMAIGLLPRDQLARFAQSSAAMLFGSANVHFWALTHYFGVDWEMDPLVMTWSLGVEEQFYLFLPPLILLLHRFAPRATVAVIVILSLLSLALSEHWTGSQPSAAFYLLPGRAWELGVGVLVALVKLRGRVWLSRGAAHWVSIAALAAVIAAIALYTEETRFPGLAATLPTLGTAALILTEPSMVNRVLLASAPMRFIGLISYSWYLWHWPMMVFGRVALGGEPSPMMLALIIVISFGAAVLSWRFLETRFRQPGTMSNPRLLRRYALAILGCLGVAGVCYGIAMSGEASAAETVARTDRNTV